MNIDFTKADWRKSSYSGANNNCVEVARNLPHAVAVRDSKDPRGPVLAMSRQQWESFTASVKAGLFDPR
jgi:hypothetical protein